MRPAQDSTDRWFRHYEWLQRYFSDEEAHQYAEQLTEAGEERNPSTERSPVEIKREMEMISHIEGAVQAVRVLVGIVVFFGLLSVVAWLRLDFCGDRCENALASIPQWASLLLLIAFTFSSIFLAIAVSDLRFWKRYLDVLRSKRMQSFWEWRSATLRFPTGHTIYSGDFDRSEPPEPSEGRYPPR
jgi:hypothetical protein